MDTFEKEAEIRVVAKRILTFLIIFWILTFLIIF